METPESFSSFQTIDYLVLIGMLSMCSMVGIYFGYKDCKKQRSNSHQSSHSAEEYLLGGRRMKVLPISISLVATYLSGVSLLGLSSEIYVSFCELFLLSCVEMKWPFLKLYGTQYKYILIAPVIMAIVLSQVIIPVFYDLKVVSVYEVCCSKAFKLCKTLKLSKLHSKDFTTLLRFISFSVLTKALRL